MKSRPYFLKLAFHHKLLEQWLPCKVMLSPSFQQNLATVLSLDSPTILFDSDCDLLRSFIQLHTAVNRAANRPPVLVPLRIRPNPL